MDFHSFVLLSLLSVLHSTHCDQPVEEELVGARHVHPLGGWSPINPESPAVQDAAKHAVEEFNTKSKAKKYFKLLDITSAATQITNMINYKMEATIGKTKCRKSENADMDRCIMGKKRLACTFEVHFNPRNDKHEVITSTCKK